jgi:tetratricopeptide (TPR) repeat protein
MVIDRGNAYLGKRDLEVALHDYNEAISLNPKNPGAYVDRGRAWGQRHQLDKALSDYAEALRLNPRQWQAYYDRAADLMDAGRLDDALSDYSKVIELNPSYGQAHINRANIFLKKKDPDKAMQECDKALSVNPNLASAYRARANAFMLKRQYREASAELEKATHLKIQHRETPLNSFAWFCATCSSPEGRDGSKAIAAATEACDLTNWLKSYDIDTLAAACAEAGKFDEAIQHQEKAIEIAARDGDTAVNQMRTRLALYKKHQPYHEDPKP